MFEIVDFVFVGLLCSIVEFVEVCLNLYCGVFYYVKIVFLSIVILDCLGW